MATFYVAIVVDVVIQMNVTLLSYELFMIDARRLVAFSRNIILLAVVCISWCLRTVALRRSWYSFHNLNTHGELLRFYLQYLLKNICKQQILIPQFTHRKVDNYKLLDHYFDTISDAFNSKQFSSQIFILKPFGIISIFFINM